LRTQLLRGQPPRPNNPLRPHPILRGRNKIVLKFLAEEEFTHLFWIDSDIAFEARSVIRLLLADRDIACALIR